MKKVDKSKTTTLRQKADELIIANKELAYQNEEKEKRAAELVIANEEKANRAAELVIANIEKAKRAAELVITNKELVYQKREKAKRAAELIIASVEKAKRATELVITNKELVLAREKEKLVVELTIVNKELTHQIEKRKQTELALKESNEKYSKAFQSSPYSITITRAEDGKFIEVNDAFTSILGFTKEEVLANSGVGLNMWVDIKEQKWVVSTLLDGKDVKGKEFLFKKKNGEIITGLYSAKIIKLNKELCIISSLNDITETKQAKKEKLESEERLKFYMDNSPMAVVEWDSNFTVTRWTGGSEKIFGWKAEEVVGKQLMDLNITYEQDIPIVQKTGEKIKSGLFTQVFSCNRNYRKDGSIITCEWYNVILKDENGKMQSVLSKILDITERKQIELALKASEKEFRSLAESMPQIVWTTRADGWNTYFNQQWVDYTGLTLEESYGHGWNTPFHPEDKQRAWDAWQKAVENNTEYSIECRLQCYDDTYNWWLIRGVPQIGAKGETEKWFGTCTDIEKIKKAELLLKENETRLHQLNADKDRFIAILGHDLKNPFNNILGLSEVLTEEINIFNSDEIKEIAGNIKKSAQITNNLLEDILMWARTQQGSIPFKPQNLSLSATCENILEILYPNANAKNINVNYSAADHINVFADIDMLKTVLRNLVSNSIKFTNYGGAINISAEENSENVTISVSDNGTGIPPDNLSKLFDISEVLTTKGTAKETGTGLGLLLCKEFVEKHGGKIWVESEYGKGSDFKFTMPIFTEQANAINN